MVISMERWVGKTAIVTGASSGIGAALTEKLVDEGLNVVALARRKDRLDELASKLSGRKGTVHPFVADIGKEADILSAFKYIKEHLGPVHVLVNNAATSVVGSLSEGKTDEWLEVLNVNVVGLCTITREAIKVMRANSIDGHIIHINSVLGHTVKNFKNNMYTPSKHAVTALTEMYRREFVQLKLKIKVTSVSCGLVNTEMISSFKNSDLYKKLEAEQIVLQPEDVVEGIIYALSTPPHVQIHELMIRPVGEFIGDT